MSIGSNLARERKKRLMPDGRPWSQAYLAEQAGVAQQLISQIENNVPSAGKDKLPQIAAALGVDAAALDPEYWNNHKTVQALKAVGATRPPSATAGLPVMASARGGDSELVLSNDPVGWERNPLDNVSGAYLAYIVGDSMEPAFEQGDVAMVNPVIPVRAGNDVILQSDVGDAGERRAMVKRLIRAGADEWQLEQFNPPKKFKVKRGEFPICHVIVGKYSRR